MSMKQKIDIDPVIAAYYYKNLYDLKERLMEEYRANKKIPGYSDIFHSVLPLIEASYKRGFLDGGDAILTSTSS